MHALTLLPVSKTFASPGPNEGPEEAAARAASPRQTDPATEGGTEARSVRVCGARMQCGLSGSGAPDEVGGAEVASQQQPRASFRAPFNHPPKDGRAGGKNTHTHTHSCSRVRA